MRNSLLLAGLALVVAGWPAAGHVEQGASGAPDHARKPEERKRTNPKDGAEIVYIPAGEFIMGSNVSDEEEKPERKITIGAYYIYRSPVTVVQYRRFCERTGRKMPPKPSWGWIDTHPVVNIAWTDADAYSRWAGASLPTEAQWEKAARGTSGRVFPWGDLFDVSRCWCSVVTVRKGTTPVGAYPNGASSYGVLDMAGNVFQWTADWESEFHVEKAGPTVRLAAAAAIPPKTPTRRIEKGGSWGVSNYYYLRSSFRVATEPANGGQTDGFRCVVAVKESH